MSESLKLSVCCCCLAEGRFRSLDREYKWLEGKENYGRMLADCFGIDITEGFESSRICGVCITQLRRAANFKRQVLESRRQMSSRAVAVKVEEVSEATSFEEGEGHFCEEFDADAYDFKPEDSIKKETELERLLTTPCDDSAIEESKDKRRKPRNASTKKSIKKDVLKLTIPDAKSAISSTKRNRMMKRNAIMILESSNVFPFKWHRQNYLCFFCHKPFKDPAILKQHSLKEHREASVKNAVTYLRRDELVKVDVTEISCKFCEGQIDDLTTLKAHLKTSHKMLFADDFKDGLIPYKLDDENFECALCNKRFQYFTKLNQHMNSHFGNYVCELCGKSFLSQDRLRCHSLSHGGHFKCNHCAEIFDSLTQRNHHTSEVHKKEKTLKCSHCSETFTSYSIRKKHHKTEHNIDIPEFKCPVCAKVFHIMSKMHVHIKEVHIREKNFSCNVCDQKFFSKNHVQKHMVKHFGERVHECSVCKKSYARKQTLRDHMRIHSNDKRFVCAVCSQGFVQNNSLKLHLRVHHPESVSG